MGRRTERVAVARALVALILLSVSGSTPAHLSQGEAVPATEGSGIPPAADLAAPETLSVLEGEEPAVPVYPSSNPPLPQGGPIGPNPLLANAIAYHHFDDAWALNHFGEGVRVAVVDEGVDFGHPDLEGTQAIVTNASSPYHGWPIVYDPRSLVTYLRTGYPDGTWYANTTRTGLGPFEVTHTIRVDGTNDFGDAEKVGADSRDKSSGDPGKVKADWDLTDLYVTRDDDNWYFGFPMFLDTQNASFVLLIDVDNATSGGYVSPRGIPVDSNTTHADRVNDVAWSPNGTWVATVAGDRLARVWDRNGALRFTTPPHANEPMSVAWSPDGTKVASADKDRIRIWDALTGALIREILYVPIGDPTITENGILAFSPNGTWIAAATYKYVQVFDIATGAKFGSVWPGNTEVNAVAFNSSGERLAVGLGDATIRVYAISPAIFNTILPAPALYTLAGPSGHSQQVLDVAWSPDGTRIVSGSRDDTAKLWNVALQSVIQTMPDHQSWVMAADWAPSGSYFVTSSRGLAFPPSFAIWDGAGNRQALVTQTKPIGGVSWSVSNEIATASEDLTSRLWTTTGVPIRILTAHRPDFALYTHGFSRYSQRENKYEHGAELGDWYRWDTPTSAWVGAPLANLSGRQAAFQFGEALFNEFAVPRGVLGDPPELSVILYSTHENGSRAQDTSPSDRNVDFPNTDFTPGWSSVSAFAWVRIESYEISGLTSASNTFHFGFHPGPSVQRRFGALGLLVADPSMPGEYDRVYLDMNGDKVFDATDVVATKADPVATLDTKGAGGNPIPDGFADVSAGMIYFIADGVRYVPYSERVYARKSGAGAQLRIPAAGDLVAFAGEFAIDPLTATLAEHGTRIASAIVGRGRVMSGTANASKLVAIMNGLSDVVESWTFAVEGYDGRPNTGDEALVVVSPFNFPTLHHDGWDSFSRTADHLSATTSQGNTTFVASAGDYGFGYGTVLSPASGPSVIAAGRAGDFSLRSSVWGGSEGPNPHVTEPAIVGSRGPSASGLVKPELLAVDIAALAVPLHAASDGSSAVSSAPSVGSDVSAAIVAGAVAILYGAFNTTHGRLPKVAEVRAMLLSGADDAGHDVLAQGSGFLNVSRSVKLAAETADAGLEVTPSVWHPGAYRGIAYPGFTRLMAPGEWDMVTFGVTNRGSASITALVEAVAYARIGRYVHTNATRTDAYQPEGDVALWVNDTGVWKVDGATLTAVQVVPPIVGAWASADLIKVTAYSNLSRLEYRVDTTFLTNYSYTLKAYDWTIDWANWFGPFGPFPAPAIFMNEMNTVGETFHQSNVLEVRSAYPATWLHEGLVISLEALDAALAVEGLEWTFEIELYERTTWPWVAMPPMPLTIPGGTTNFFAANLSVPPTADMGSYEAAILVRDQTYDVTTTVPVLVNVAADGPRLSFGGNLLTTDLYDNSRLFGGYDRALSSPTRLRRPAMGDWRFFYFDIPSQGVWEASAGYKILVRTAWRDAPSDVDTFAFGRTTADAASQGNSSYYGPFTLKQAGKSEELDKPQFMTATGGGAEVIAYDLVSGLNVIALRAFAMRGLEAEVRLLPGEAGWVNTPTGLDVATPFRRCDVANATVRDGGCARFSFLSNMDLPGLRASAVGPAQTTAFTDAEIPQDVQSWWNFPGWGEWMFRASFTYTFQVQKALILEVAIQGKSDVEDLDMAVFRDGNENGILDPEEYLVIDCQTVAPGLCLNGDLWNYNADGDADERVKWIDPPDGQYIVKVLGFTVLANPGHFDMQVSITLATGKGYEVWEAPKPAEVVNGTTPVLPALTRVSMNMTWDFPNTTADDAYGGAVLLGLLNAPGVIVVPVLVLLDRRAPEIVGFKVNALYGRVNAADNRTTNDPAPQLAVSVQDLDWGQLDRTSARLVLDGVDMSGIATIGIQPLPRGGRVGFWDGTLILTPPSPLDESAHTLDATIGDRAGNAANASFTFIVDVTAPPLFVGTLLQYTTLDTFTVSGTTEPDASVNVRGVWYPVGPSGAFAISVPLLEGPNALTVTAADWFEIDASGNLVAGNFATITQTIVRDLRAPEFVRWGADPGGSTRADETVVTGLARDPLSASEFGRPQDIVLNVDSPGFSGPVPILSDGTFLIVVPLVEGANAITATLRDLAGNERTASLTVTRDTAAPTLTVSVVQGTTVHTSAVTVRGATEAGAFVTVNGIAIGAPGGAFETTVTLSPGRNVVVVQALDVAGNVATRELVITFEADTGLSPGLAAGMLAAGGALGVLVAFLLVRAGVRIPLLSRKPDEETVADTGVAAEPEAEAPSHEPMLAEEPAGDPRSARLSQAYEDGRITREVYEENLRRLREGGVT